MGIKKITENTFTTERYMNPAAKEWTEGKKGLDKARRVIANLTHQISWKFRQLLRVFSKHDWVSNQRVSNGVKRDISIIINDINKLKKSGISEEEMNKQIKPYLTTIGSIKLLATNLHPTKEKDIKIVKEIKKQINNLESEIKDLGSVGNIPDVDIKDENTLVLNAVTSSIQMLNQQINILPFADIIKADQRYKEAMKVLNSVNQKRSKVTVDDVNKAFESIMKVFYESIGQ